MKTNQQVTSPNINNYTITMNPEIIQNHGEASAIPTLELSSLETVDVTSPTITNSEIVDQEWLATQESSEPQSADCTPAMSATPAIPATPACDDDDTDAGPDEMTKKLLALERNPACPDVEVEFHKAGRDYHLPQFEVALLSVCLNKPSIFVKVCRDLQPGDLYLADHSEIFRAMLHVHNAGKTISNKRVLRHLVSVRPEKEDEWIKQLETLSATSGHFKQLKSYIRQLKEAARIRGGGTYCPENYSEDFSANLLLARHRQTRCVNTTWYCYEHGVWGEEKSHVFRPHAMKVIHPTHRQAKRCHDVLTHVESLSQFPGHRFRGAYRFAEGEAVLINVANCVIRVSSQGEITLLDHSPDFDFTRKVATAYDPAARCDLFRTKLEEILQDLDDRELFQVFSGYCLYPSCKFETSLVAYGPGGTGKSTMATVIAEVLGSDLVGSSGLEELCKAGSYSLPKLKLKMLCLGSELTGKEAVESANFKKLVSGEAMDVRQIYCDPEEMKTSCKLMFLTNNPPRFYSGTDAETRRLRILHFDSQPVTKDPDLKEKLLAEVPGILNWMLEGLVKLLRIGRIPQGGEAAKAVLKNFGKDNDPVGSFVNERCVLAANHTVVKRDLFAEFTDWCDDNGLSAEKMEVFFWKTLRQRHPQLEPVRLTINGEREHCLTGINLFTPREETSQVPAKQRSFGAKSNDSLVGMNRIKEKLRTLAAQKEAANRGRLGDGTDALPQPMNSKE